MSTMQQGPAPVPPIWRWDTFATVVIPISGFIAAIAGIIITYQISRISDLSGEIKNVTGRIDQIYPLLAQSTADFGYIKGSLEATTQKISAAVEKNDSLTKRIEALVASQETQSKNIQDLSSSMSKLIATVNAQQYQLEEIGNKVNSINPLIQKNNFLADWTIFSPGDLTRALEENTPRAKIIPIESLDKRAWFSLFKSLEDSSVDLNKVVLTTRDATVADNIKQILLKEGFLLAK